MGGGIAVQFAEGRKDGWEVGPLLGMICRCIGIGREDVGNIKLRDNGATVELSSKGAALFDSRKERLAREGLNTSSVRPIEGSGERRENSREGYRGDSRPPRRDRDHRQEGSRDGERPKRRRFVK